MPGRSRIGTTGHTIQIIPRAMLIVYSRSAVSRAQQEGLGVLLTGGFGDHLYCAGVEWLADLLVEGRFLEAGQELGLYLRYAGLCWIWRAGYLQSVARSWVSALLPSGRGNNLNQTVKNWLTAFSVSRASSGSSGSKKSLAIYENLLGLVAAASSTLEIFNANRYGIELRHPYRDRRLVEYVLSLPAHQLYYHNVNKRILRTAMNGILPETVRTRLQPTSLGKLFNRGLTIEKDRLDTILHASGDVLIVYIQADWLLDNWDVSNVSKMNETQAMVFWLCFSYMKWVDRLRYGTTV